MEETTRSTVIFRDLPDDRERVDVAALDNGGRYRTELFAVSRAAYRWREWPAELTFEYDQDGVARTVARRIVRCANVSFGS